MNELSQFRAIWSELWDAWRTGNAAESPLHAPDPQIVAIEERAKSLAIQLLNTEEKEEEELFAAACAIRDDNLGRILNLRAVVDVSNVCKVDCMYCPMRRSNLQSELVSRATTEQILLAASAAQVLGFRQLFLQAGEDPLAVGIVINALRALREKEQGWHVVLNLGNLSLSEYRALKQAGAHGYLIKHETANAKLHLAYRGETLEKRIQHTLWAREAGLYVGSGIILGLPQQTDEDLAHDLILLGRLDSSKMASCAPFTPSEELPAAFRNHASGSFEKTRRFIALLRHCFPSARIPATSNLDSKRMQKTSGNHKSGQAQAIEAGANGITVQFTPLEVEQRYALYERGSEKEYLVYIGKAEQVARETGLLLDLIR